MSDTPTNLREVVLAGGALGFNWLPVYVADAQGLFAREGLSVRLVRTGSVDTATAAAKAGETDLAITPPEGAVADYLEGGQLRIVAGNVNRLPLTLIAQPEIKSVGDLKGKVLGTSSLTEGTAVYTIEMLSQAGLKYPDDFEFSVVGVHPARWKALQERTIDAAVQLIPLNFVAIDAGYSNLGEVSDCIPEIVFTTMVARADWIAANREVLDKLRSALKAATAWLYDPRNGDALSPLVTRATQAEPAYVAKSLDYMREKGVFSRDLDIPAGAFTTTLRLMVKCGLMAEGDVERARGVLLPEAVRG